MDNELSRMIAGCAVRSVEVEGYVDMTDNEVSVALVHDSSGFCPCACVYITNLSEHTALEQAFDMLETSDEESLTKLEKEERNKSIEEGSDSLTEGYDGKSFVMTPQELERIINSIESKITQLKFKEVIFSDSEGNEYQKFQDVTYTDAFGVCYN